MLEEHINSTDAIVALICGLQIRGYQALDSTQATVEPDFSVHQAAVAELTQVASNE